MTDTIVDLREERNILTIFSDTSLCPETGAAGWGVWMRDKERGKAFGGYYQREIISSNMGEFYAALHAIKIARETKLLERCHYIVFVCDNQRVVDLLNGHDGPIADWEREGLIELRQFLKDYNLEWKANKVKAHTGTKKPRTWVNDQCDKLAKKYMKLMREHRRSKDA